MLEQASIRFYEIKHCGLYRQFARSSTLGCFSDVINNIHNWASAEDRLIQSTCTYEVNEDSDMDFLETYLLSSKKCSSTGDILLTFWNRTHSSGDSVYALDAAAKVDNLSSDKFHHGDLPATSIPGFATYFWFVPYNSVMATITFGSPRSGMKALTYWIESFLRTESRYASFNNLDEFTGYKAADGSIHLDLVPKFVKCLYKNPAKKNMIISNRESIKGLTRRISLDRSQLSDQTIFDKLKKRIGINTTPEVNTHEIALKYEFDYTPTASELNEIISTYENSETKSNWEDVGFLFSQNNAFGASPKEWLSKSYAKTKQAIDIKWLLAGQLVNSEALSVSFQTQRQELLRLLNYETSEEMQNVS